MYKNEIDRAIEESLKEQEKLSKSYFERIVSHHVETYEELSGLMAIVYTLVLIGLTLLVLSITASGKAECYYEMSSYNNNIQYVLASIDWREDRLAFVSEDYEEVKEWLKGKEICE